MQAIIDREGGPFKLASWDWWYYAEKLRKEKNINLDESETRPYFSLDNVRQGIFYVAGQLYGLNFEKRTDVPVYHPEVEVWEVRKGRIAPGPVVYGFFPVTESQLAPGIPVSGIRHIKTAKK
jgi:Zn-dependent oligopeptidase